MAWIATAGVMPISPKLRSERGDSNVIFLIGAFCIGVWIFFGVVDWIKGSKDDKYQRNLEASMQAEAAKNFVPRELERSKVTY
jgi:hypothetical protein